MQLNRKQIRRHLQAFDFTPLFIEELGWDHHRGTLQVHVEGEIYPLETIAQKRGMVAYVCRCQPLPEYRLRRRIEHQVARSVHEHVVVYTDAAQTTQVWQWVKREPGRPIASREHRYDAGQPGDSLIQRLEAIAFSLQEEEGLTIVDVTSRVRAAFDVEQVTRRFYDRFQAEHDAFLKFLKGMPGQEMARWYVSVMLNRLMFIYFIQKKGFLDGDPDYLRHRLAQSQQRGLDRFYREFLCPLFFEGFARRASARSPQTCQLLGQVPYLNGGLFLRHEIERLYGEHIQVPDAAFEGLFAFFERYQWHLDNRPLRADNEINPDVLGYIFEKYVNQKEMGAYYTREDITDYISKNTIVPFLLDRVNQACPAAFEGEHAIWGLLQEEPDRYIYPAVRHGAHLDLPPEIAAGLDDVSRRGGWNTPAPQEYALPTEIWREVVARRRHYQEARGKMAAGQVCQVNDLVTLNLDVRQFAQDVVGNCDDPAFLRAFWRAVNEVTILDPTVGSGAFLFAALNALEPLYEGCLERMARFLEEAPPGSRKYTDFRQILERVAQHPKERYFIFKSIIVNNLYGVDIMDEAVEIAKLRLFLKLVAEVDSVEKIEPLPDIDFNVRAGNTLVGFATYAEVERAVRQAGAQLKMVQLLGDPMQAIEEKAQDVDRLYQHFRQQQTELGGEVTPEDKQALRERLEALNEELDRYLAREYGVDADLPLDFRLWRESHKPFHWFVEFYGILKQGGVDVIIGNPPYVEYHKVKKAYQLPPGLYRSERVGNLYAFCMERSGTLLKALGRFGMIVPVGALGLDKALSLREVLLEEYAKHMCSTYAIRPSKLFEGVDQRLCIYLASDRQPTQSDLRICATQYRCWNAEERATLFPTLVYGGPSSHQRLKRIPQIGGTESASIISKIEKKNRKPIASYLSPNKTGYLLHYHRSPRYWIRAMDFEQYFRSSSRTRSIYHFRDLYFRHEDEGRVIGAVLNSSLFFLWFVSVGNGRNITGVDVEQFPIGDLTSDVLTGIPEIFGRLMEDYQANSITRVRQDCEYQEFYPGKSKVTIDEIDRALAHHYGFTNEEIDFIINYDVKYRMGEELFENDEGGSEKDED